MILHNPLTMNIRLLMSLSAHSVRRRRITYCPRRAAFGQPAFLRAGTPPPDQIAEADRALFRAIFNDES
jgi:hypothetical protein